MTADDLHEHAAEHGLEDHGEKDKAAVQAGLLGAAINRGGVIFAIGLIVSMLILIQEVFLRYVLNSPTIWAHETTIFLCAAAFIYGGLYCAARDSHIRVVIIYDVMKGRARRALDVAISLVCAAASAFFAWAAWLMVERAIFTPDGSFRLETSGSAWNPPIPGLLKVFMFSVLLVMAIQFVVLAWNYARGKTSTPSTTAGEGDA
jgi:C4-dicarboxylate transporter DctQ subunit